MIHCRYMGIGAAGVLAFRTMLVVTSRSSEMPKEGYALDLHVHVAGISAGDSGCFVSEAMTNGYIPSIYSKHSASMKSRYAKKVMDGVIVDEELDRERTPVYLPKEYPA